VSPPGVEAVLVDTDVFSYLMNGSGYASLYRPHVEGKLMAISFITVGELYFGAYKRKWGNDKLDDLKDRLRSATIVPFDEGVCKKYAEIKAVESKGKSIGANDLWIAACAVRHAIPLVSNNAKHFAEIPGLVLRSESRAMREMQSQISITTETVKPASTEPK
jgi:tRNA(fMet)-specific endonuclease VapC